MPGADDEEPSFPVVCPECETETRVGLSDLEESIDRHNDQLHDGAEVAQIDPAVADEMLDLAAEDMGLYDE